MYPRRMTSQAATLGRSDVTVPRLGVGAMTWGDPKGLARWTPPSWPTVAAPTGPRRSRRALEASVAGRRRPSSTPRRCTARGASERRLGELARGTGRPHRHQVPAEPVFPSGRTCHRRLSQSRAPRAGSRSTCTSTTSLRAGSIRELMERMADAVEAGKVQGGRRQQLFGRPDAHRARCPRAAAAIPLASNQVEYSAPAPAAGGGRRARRLPRVWGSRSSPTSRWPAGALTGKYLTGPRPTGLRRFMPRFGGNAARGHRPVVGFAAGDRRPRTPGARRRSRCAGCIENETVLPIPGAKNEQPGGRQRRRALLLASPQPRSRPSIAATAAWRGTKGTTS